MTKKNTLELIDVLREELDAAGLCFGVDRSRDLTESVVRRVVSRVGGMHLYARTSVRSRGEVKAAIVREFNGANLREVARRHGVSERTVYRAVSEARQSEGLNK